MPRFRSPVGDLCGADESFERDSKRVSIATRSSNVPSRTTTRSTTYRAAWRVRRDQSRGWKPWDPRIRAEFRRKNTNPNSERWSGARDLNPRPHGHEPCRRRVLVCPVVSLRLPLYSNSLLFVFSCDSCVLLVPEIRDPAVTRREA